MATLLANKWLLASPDDRPERVAARAVRRRLANVWKRLARASKAKQPSAKRIHELRVAARRADAALELFAEFLPKNRAAKQKKQLAHIRRAAGAARDLDVLSGRLTSEMADPAANELKACLSKQRRKAGAPIVKLYKRLRRGRTFQDRSRDLVERIRRRSKAGEAGRKLCFGDWTRSKLDGLVAEFFAAEPAPEWDQKAWHTFRIQGKALRYALELAASAFSRAWREELYPLVAELQDRLGTINDLSTAREQLADLEDLPDEARSALTEFVDRQEARLDETRDEFVAWYFDHARHALREGFDRELAHDVRVAELVRVPG